MVKPMEFDKVVVPENSSKVPCSNRSQAALQKRAEHRPLFCQTLLADRWTESLSIGWVFTRAPSCTAKKTQNMKDL